MSTKRYPSDLTDKEWEVLEALFPKPRKPGRPRKYSLREILNGIFYALRSGCSWRMMPKDLPQDGLPLLQGVEGGGDLGEDKPGASEEDKEEAWEG